MQQRYFGINYIQLTVFQLGLSSIDQKHIHDAVRHYDFRGSLIDEKCFGLSHSPLL